MIKEIIDKKRLGFCLSNEELSSIFMGYMNGEVADYQMSSLLMAICINGMSEEEVFHLTDIFIQSGDTLDFSHVPGVKVDKHSTGGIGDKTTLVIVPVVASLGVPVIKMSGRGLGYTGGTIDKLESISGFRTNLTNEEVGEAVSKVGAVITGQTANLVPLDQMIYALRDVTATVSSIPLIAVSIMSKKIAAGADKILLDVKYGKGALVATYEEAEQLAILMQKIGKQYHREVRYVISNMDHPLGNNIGNGLEVEEAVQTLKGEVNGHFYDLCVELASHMISMAKDISYDEAVLLVEEVIKSGKAYEKFQKIVINQGGDLTSIQISSNIYPVYSEQNGTIKDIDALEIGKLSLSLGAGRCEKSDPIDYGVGVVLCKNIGDDVQKGDLLMRLYIHNDDFEVNQSTFEIN